MIEKLRFLLADDDADDISIFKSILHELSPNAVIHTVDDGRKAVEYL